MKILLAVALAPLVVSAAAPRALTVERVTDPVGVDVACPRLGWTLPEGAGAQTAYEIEADGWRSGKVVSPDHVDIPWNGRRLVSSETVGWRVRVWTGDGEVSDWSARARFVTGIMDPSDWKARWIGARIGEKTLSPAFERRFAVRDGLTRAVLHVTGLGFYEATLNGEKVGRKVLDPAPTDYEKRVLYSTFEVGEMLRPGENALRLSLGHGWYDVQNRPEHWDFDAAPWRSRPRGLAQLELGYSDGSRDVIVTDETWEQVEGAVAYDNIREGEVIGPRRANACPVPPGTRARIVPPPKGTVLQAETIPGAEVTALVAPQEIRVLPDGRTSVVFPEAVSGWARLTLRGQPAGSEVAVRYDENPPDRPRKIDIFFTPGPAPGECGCAASVMQCDRFFASGRPVETFEPRFVWHGFRYLLVEGLKAPLAADDVRAVSVRSAIPETGSFACSDRTLTRLVEMALNSYRLNYTDGVPTDCPHREKLGWTGDAWVASEMGQRYFDGTLAYEKWLRDVLDTQRATGEISCIAPTSGWGYQGQWVIGPVFDAVLGMLPWNLWTYGADRHALDMAYAPLKRWLAFERRFFEVEPDLVFNGLGDWKTCSTNEATEEYVISCLYLRLREIAGRMAEVRGLSAEAEEFSAAAARTRQALRTKYARGGGVFDNGGQCAQALAIVFGLADGGERVAAGERLVAACAATDWHIDFGLMGAKYVYRALAAIGRHDVAYRLLTNPTPPSMTKWLDGNGCLWEDFGDGLSKCHVMMGDFAAWCQEEISGIAPAAPGYAKIRIAPKVFGGIRWAKGAVKTPYGRIETDWEDSPAAFRLAVRVPPGTTAEVVLPDGTSKTVGPGESRFDSVKKGSGT